MNIALHNQSEPRTAIIAIIDPSDEQMLRRLRAILPPSAFLQVPLSVDAIGLVDHAPVPQFTERQQAIVALLRQNMSNKQIGRALAISHFTVRNHVSQILRLLNAASRGEAIAAINRLDMSEEP
jgi:DNA-binding NarL/FixJ family response regulator